MRAAAQHETWCATHEGRACDCTMPDGHPCKPRHEADKAFFRGALWMRGQLVATPQRPALTISHILHYAN